MLAILPPRDRRGRLKVGWRVEHPEIEFQRQLLKMHTLLNMQATDLQYEAKTLRGISQFTQS